MAKTQIQDTRAAEIRRLHEKITASLQTTVDDAIREGELLTEHKADLDHGEWLPFLASVGIKARTAQEYMRFYENRAALKSASLAHLAEARRLLVAEDDQHDEFSILWKRQEFTIPYTTMRIVWDGPDIKRRAKDDPYVPRHELWQILKLMTPSILEGGDLEVLTAWRDFFIFPFAQQNAEILIDIEAKIGELGA